MKKKIALGNQLIDESKLFEAKALFTKLLETNADDTCERIIKNRLTQINKQIKNANHCLKTSSKITSDHLICTIKIQFKADYIEELIGYLFKQIHRKDYADTSTIRLNFFGNAGKVELKSQDVDERCCTFCKKFRYKLIENIGKEDIIIEENCYLNSV